MNNWGTGWTYWMIGDCIHMREQGKKLVELEPHFFGGHLILGTEHWAMGRYEEAIAEVTVAVAQNNGAFTLSFLGTLFGIMGEQVKANEVLKKLLDMSLSETVGNYEIAMVYAGLDNKELTFRWLEKGLEQHEGMMVFLKHWARLVPWFSKNARMDDLLKKVGL